jgi:hypothetical protein
LIRHVRANGWLIRPTGIWSLRLSHQNPCPRKIGKACMSSRDQVQVGQMLIRNQGIERMSISVESQQPGTCLSASWKVTRCSSVLYFDVVVVTRKLATSCADEGRLRRGRKDFAQVNSDSMDIESVIRAIDGLRFRRTVNRPGRRKPRTCSSQRPLGR